jgi:hypothetical protein
VVAAVVELALPATVLEEQAAEATAAVVVAVVVVAILQPAMLQASAEPAEPQAIAPVAAAVAKTARTLVLEELPVTLGTLEAAPGVASPVAGQRPARVVMLRTPRIPRVVGAVAAGTTVLPTYPRFSSAQAVAGVAMRIRMEEMARAEEPAGASSSSLLTPLTIMGSSSCRARTG